jgi:hypothetical protein
VFGVPVDSSSLILAGAGAALGCYGIYLATARSRRESWLEQQYRNAFGDKQPTPNPYVLRNNRYVGILMALIGFGLAALVLAGPSSQGAR